MIDKRRIFINEETLKKNSPFKMYFLGLMASDGCVYGNGSITLSQSGKYGNKLLRQIIHYLGFNGNIYKSKNAYSIYFRSENITNILKQYNIIPRKSLIYKFPKNIPQSLLAYFIRGYFDGDGSLGYYKTNTSHIFTMNFVGTKSFIRKCQQKLPIKGNIRKIFSAKNCWEIRWYGNKALEIYSYLYKSTSKLEILSAKQIKFNNLKMHSIKTPKHKTYKNKFIDAYQSGLSIMEISKKLKIPFQTLYKWKKRFKL